MTKAEIRLERLFSEIITKLPWTAGIVKWLRNPKNAFVRIPVALLLILGGIFSFLPILGLWMLPLGSSLNRYYLLARAGHKGYCDCQA